jgi:hypothetical protein
VAHARLGRGELRMGGEMKEIGANEFDSFFSGAVPDLKGIFSIRGWLMSMFSALANTRVYKTPHFQF